MLIGLENFIKVSWFRFEICRRCLLLNAQSFGALICRFPIIFEKRRTGIRRALYLIFAFPFDVQPHIRNDGDFWAALFSESIQGAHTYIAMRGNFVRGKHRVLPYPQTHTNICIIYTYTRTWEYVQQSTWLDMHATDTWYSGLPKTMQLLTTVSK